MARVLNRVDYRLGSLYALVTAALYAVQEPFSFLAANRLSAIQFVCLTQIALFLSLPLLMASPASRRDLVALMAKPSNYGKLAVVFGVGMSGLLLYNFGLSDTHPIIVSAVLNLLPFWAALVALVLARVPIPVSPLVFFGCFAGAFLGALIVAWSQLDDRQSTDALVSDLLQGSWIYALPVPICTALGGLSLRSGSANTTSRRRWPRTFFSPTSCSFLRPSSFSIGAANSASTARSWASR